MAWVRLLLPLLVVLTACADAGQHLVVSRHYHGDVFAAASQSDGCSAEFCLSRGGLPTSEGGCGCRCQEPYPTFREDTSACVNTIPECHLADFSTGSTQEKLPFVFMPEPGSLVHPSAEITMADVTPDDQPVVAPVCVVSGSQVVTDSGWRALNASFEPPFRLQRDQGKTFLQWVGGGISADEVSGRIVLVKLLCKDAGNPHLQRFSPCVAFRIAGTKGPEVTAAADAGSSPDNSLAVGLSVAAILALYLVAMTAYMVYRRRRRRRRGGDQLIEDALMGKTSGAVLSSRDQEQSSRRRSPNARDKSRTSPVPSAGHVTSRPSEVGERAPESGLSGLVQSEWKPDSAQDGNRQDSDRDAQQQKKLYFTSDFFHPDLLHDPPAAALEFVSRIREMMGVARQKLQTRQFQPSLPTIDEADDEEAPPASASATAAAMASASASASRVDIDMWLESVARGGGGGGGTTSWGQRATRAAQAARTAREAAQIAAQTRRPAATDSEDGESSGGASEPAASLDEDWSESDTTEDSSDGTLGGAETEAPRVDSPPRSEWPAPPAAPDSLYEEINISDHSLSTLRGGRGGDAPDSAAGGSDADRESSFDPETLDRRRAGSRPADGKRTFGFTSLEGRGGGATAEEGFGVAHASTGPVMDTSLESVDSAYRYWGSLRSCSDASSSYSRINFVSGRSQPDDAVASESSVAPRKLTTFKECSAARQGVTMSLLDQWRKKTEQTRSASPLSMASSVSVPMGLRSPDAGAGHESASSTLRKEKAEESSLAAPPEPARTPVPPLPPRSSAVRGRHGRTRQAPPVPAASPPAPPGAAAARPPPPRPGRAVHQPPLPPKRAAPPPPPLPSKARAPLPSPHSRLMPSRGDGRAVRTTRRHRQDSAGESETNSTGSSHDESDGAGSSMSVSPVSRLSSGSACRATPSSQLDVATCRHGSVLPPRGNTVLPSHGLFSNLRSAESEAAGRKSKPARTPVDVDSVRPKWQYQSGENPTAARQAYAQRPTVGRNNLKRLVEKFDGGDRAKRDGSSGNRLLTVQ